MKKAFWGIDIIPLQRETFRYIVFQGETEPTPTHYNQLVLPSGINVVSIELWIEKLMAGA